MTVCASPETGFLVVASSSVRTIMCQRCVAVFAAEIEALIAVRFGGGGVAFGLRVVEGVLVRHVAFSGAVLVDAHEWECVVDVGCFGREGAGGV